MNLPASTHWIAAMAFERMLYCLAEGMALAAIISVLLRLFPGKNSQTRFAVWFSTLLAVALLPLLGLKAPWRPLTANAVSQHALLTISASWAEYVILVWAALALVGLLRVIAGLWQIRRLRRACVAMDPQLLTPESRTLIAEFQKRRPVSILISSALQVPTAIGFVHPAIVIPAWLAEEPGAAELKFVLLHELAHLRRWDDWTNLAQKLVKAILFFHPGVWWIERKLSLDREMACDDAVLAQTASPRVYAQCLARVAEESFLRRQMALAQAAVDRMKQLSQRVTRILDGDRPRSTRLWKPAIPMVMGAAVLCAVSTSNTPELVRLTDGQPIISASSANVQIPLARSGGADQVVSKNSTATANMAKIIPARASAQTGARAWPAALKSVAAQNSYLPARYRPAKHVQQQNKSVAASRDATPERQPVLAPPAALAASDVSREGQKDAQASDVMVLVVASRRVISTGSVTWQVSTWELCLVVPANRPAKQIPRKT